MATHVDIIVPAYNEAPRIGRVLEVVTQLPGASVLVVDDGSTDGTSDIARAHPGVRVLELKPNRGKGGAMLASLEATSAPIVMFVDADLLGLTPQHLQQLVSPLLERAELGQVVGMRDRPGFAGEVQRSMPIISGERAVRRAILERMPRELWSGFKVEAGINDTVSRSGHKTGLVQFHGVTIVDKTEKFGIAKGFAKYVDMTKEIVTAMTDARRAAAEQPNPFGPPRNDQNNPFGPVVASGQAGNAVSAANPQLNRLRAAADAQPPVVQEAPPAASLTAKCDSVECVADAIMGSAVKAAEPMVVEKVIPQVLADHRALAVVGRNVGYGIADRLVSRLWIALLLIAAIVAAASFAGGYYGQRARQRKPSGA
jgi:hypothetical protein